MATVEGKAELRALGDAIRAERERIDVSQEDFAELCGVHRTYVGQLERGEKNVSLTNVLRVARACRIKPSTLLARAGL
jgi:transcriptional regulator with XRE-family HTH domain